MHVEWNAIWLFVLGIGVVRLLPVLDGWERVARRYPLRSPVRGEEFAFVPAMLRASFGVYVHVCVARDGVAIRVRWPPLWHPPVFIPWSEVTRCERTGLFGGGTRLVCRGAPNVPIRLVGRAGQAARAEWERRG